MSGKAFLIFDEIRQLAVTEDETVISWGKPEDNHPDVREANAIDDEGGREEVRRSQNGGSCLNCKSKRG